jgi:hypothetical protein
MGYKLNALGRQSLNFGRPYATPSHFVTCRKPKATRNDLPVEEAFHVIKYSMAETFGKVADCLSSSHAPDTKTIHDLDTELRALENSAWPWLKFGEWQTLPTEGDTTPQRHMIALLKDKALLGGCRVCSLREARNTDFVGARHFFSSLASTALCSRASLFAGTFACTGCSVLYCMRFSSETTYCRHGVDTTA